MEIELYCDESRQDLFNNPDAIQSDNRYVCIGGIWIEKSCRENLKNEIKELQRKHNTYGEIKWKNVSNSKYTFYQALVDLFFRIDNSVRFRCLVVDASKVDLRTYHNSDAELGFYKFYYQLINNWISYPNNYYIFMDFKKNRRNNRINELKIVLNNSHYSPIVKNIQAINSKESLVLQLEDVIMGAVGYKYNFLDTGKSIPKSNLVKYIEKINGSIVATPLSETKFNIFEIQLGTNGGLR